jgi:precorrin-6Y C5,15-methyltransferase (decarboxylating)
VPEGVRTGSWIAVVGLWSGDAGELDRLVPPARAALAQAQLVASGSRLADAARSAGHLQGVPWVNLSGGIEAALDAIDEAPGQVCVLASGDPGFFGVVRPLAARFGSQALHVYPAPSSVSLAFARLAMSWDDAVVVSAHGRSLDEALDAAAGAPKVAVLTSPQSPPEAVARGLSARGQGGRRAVVCSRLGGPAEGLSDAAQAGAPEVTEPEVTEPGVTAPHVTAPKVTEGTLRELSAGSFDPVSVLVILEDPDAAGPVAASTLAPGLGARPGAATLAWGRPDELYEHRANMLTKSEVRAVVLSKLALGSAADTGVMWDLGAGSASVAIECALSCPALRVFAVERDSADAARARANAKAAGLVAPRFEVIEGEAPAALADLPDPDRVFVGGGGIDVLRSAMARLRPGGLVVATFAALDRAALACSLLGEMVQVSVSHARALPDGGIRLAADNPVFVVWGSP